MFEVCNRGIYLAWCQDVPSVSGEHTLSNIYIPSHGAGVSLLNRIVVSLYVVSTVVRLCTLDLPANSLWYARNLRGMLMIVYELKASMKSKVK